MSGLSCFRFRDRSFLDRITRSFHGTTVTVLKWLDLGVATMIKLSKIAKNRLMYSILDKWNWILD